MSAPLPKDPTFWLPAPDNPPPIEERAKNLVWHFGRIALVVVVLGTPVLFAALSRGGANRAGDGLAGIGAALQRFRGSSGGWPADLRQLGAGPASCPGCGRAWDGWWGYEAWRPEGGVEVRWTDRPPPDAPGDMPAVWCAACRAVLRADGTVETGGSAPGSAPPRVRAMVPRR